MPLDTRGALLFPRPSFPFCPSWGNRLGRGSPLCSRHTAGPVPQVRRRARAPLSRLYTSQSPKSARRLFSICSGWRSRPLRGSSKLLVTACQWTPARTPSSASRPATRAGSSNESLRAAARPYGGISYPGQKNSVVTYYPASVPIGNCDKLETVCHHQFASNHMVFRICGS